MTTAQRIAQLMEMIAKEEAWLEHYLNVGISSPKTEENIAAYRYELAQLREKVGLT